MISRLFVLLTTLLTTTALAAEIPNDASLRCIQAAVKIVALGPTGGGTGSGTMIDPRGYVLTNFHVVGHSDARNGAPGSLVNPDNEVKLAIVNSARDIARPTWVGKVIRADMRLDLALVRIIKDGDGNPVKGAPFKTIPIKTTENLQPGNPLWAFGYPLGVRTINVTGGNLTGFEFNAKEQISWLRTDAEFNPGNSGGMLVDKTGALVAIPTRVWRGGALEPVELARPAERIPKAWLDDLKKGHIDDVQLNTAPTLVHGEVRYETASGDGASMGSSEILYYQLPNGQPGAVTSSDFIELVLVKKGDKIARRAKGKVKRIPQDPNELFLATVVPPVEDKAMEYFVKFEAAPNTKPTEPTKPPDPVAPSTLSALNFDSVNSMQGTVVDAITGKPISLAMVLVAHPEVDLPKAIAQVRAGQISGTAFDKLLVNTTRTDGSGRFALMNLPKGNTYPYAVFEKNYRILVGTVAIPKAGTDPVGAGRLMMTP